jgi:hypothetical protein
VPNIHEFSAVVSDNKVFSRRRLLQGLAAASAAWLSPAQARPAAADPIRARLAANPLLTPFLGVDDTGGDRHTASVPTRGRWPEALRGRFYRNGPALFERAGQRYHHWFDGDGMVQQFRIEGGRVAHRGRLVRTAKLAREREAGRFVVDGFGTTFPGQAPAAGRDSFNTANTSALAGIKVVEMGQLLAGPFCGQLLGDMGADVVKIEPPGAGDPMRNWGQGDEKVQWEVIARNKRSVTCNLRVPEGQELARQLIADADVLIENFKPGTLERWGMSPAELQALNPGLIIARMKGFGARFEYQLHRPIFAS